METKRKIREELSVARERLRFLELSRDIVKAEHKTLSNLYDEAVENLAGLRKSVTTLLRDLEINQYFTSQGKFDEEAFTRDMKVLRKSQKRREGREQAMEIREGLRHD